MDDNHIKEQLSKAYAHAICSMAGCTTAQPLPDCGIDLQIEKTIDIEGGYIPSGLCLAIQLKSTTDYRIEEEQIVYSIENRAYNILAQSNVATKRILVLFLLPSEKNEWLTQDLNSLIIRKCAYWYSLEGQEQKINENSSTTIRIPIRNLFSLDNLKLIFDKIEEGESPNELL